MAKLHYENEGHMKERQNELYEAPESIVQELKFEGIICTSGDVPGMPGYSGGGDPFNPLP